MDPKLEGGVLPQRESASVDPVPEGGASPKGGV